MSAGDTVTLKVPLPDAVERTVGFCETSRGFLETQADGRVHGRRAFGLDFGPRGAELAR